VWRQESGKTGDKERKGSRERRRRGETGRRTASDPRRREGRERRKRKRGGFEKWRRVAGGLLVIMPKCDVL